MEVANAGVKNYSKELAILAGCGAIALALGLSPVAVVVGLGYLTFIDARSLVESIVQKTVLQTMIEDIDVQLDMQNSNTQESVGRRRW